MISKLLFIFIYVVLIAIMFLRIYGMIKKKLAAEKAG
jgi:hypothetical protein